MRNKYPYTDFHELNADWLLETVKEAADEAGSMNDRVTTLEGGMRDVASSVSDLTAGVGRLSSAVTDLTDRVDDAENDIDTLDTKVGEANADIATLQDEVETPTTGLLDRVTALENAPAGQSNAVLYLEFDSSLISVDPSTAWDARITYDYLKSYYPLNTSGEGLQEIKLYDINSQRVFSLNQFHKQESVTPNGGFTFTCRVPNYSGGSLVSYNNYGVVVAQSATTPAYTETVEIPLPEVSIADSGSFLAVDENGEWGLDQPSEITEVVTYPIALNPDIDLISVTVVKHGRLVTVFGAIDISNEITSGDLLNLGYPAISFTRCFTSQGTTGASVVNKIDNNSSYLSILTTPMPVGRYYINISYITD